MKKYAILTYWAKGMSNGTAPDESGAARLNEGKLNSSQKNHDGTLKDLIRDENGKIKQFISQVDALNYCITLGWNLEQTLFESHEGFNARDPYSSFIFVLSKSES
jgi:hypothetical protein